MQQMDNIHMENRHQEGSMGALPLISEWLLLEPPSQPLHPNEHLSIRREHKTSKLTPEERSDMLAKQAQRRREARRKVKEDPEKYVMSKSREAEQKRLWRERQRTENTEKYQRFKEKEAFRKKQARASQRKKDLQSILNSGSDSESLELLDMPADTSSAASAPDSNSNSCYKNGDNAH